MIIPLTPSQTLGPYFAIGLPWPEGPYAVAPGTAGAITIRGAVYDGAGDADSGFPARNMAGRSGWALRRRSRTA